MNETVLLDPTSQMRPDVREGAAPLPTLDGVTVGLVDIAKARGDVFLDRLAGTLAQRGIGIERFRKPTHAKVAPVDLRRRIAERCDAVVVALAD